MAGQAQRIADLEDRVAFLAAELERYHREACVVRMIEEAIGHPMTTSTIRASYAPQQQPRHLRAVPDSEVGA